MLLLILRLALAIFFILAGINHFISPEVYLGIMPAYLPSTLLLVQVSGVAEVMGGIGVLIPRLRKTAGWGLIVLLVAVFPANIHAALHGMVIHGHAVPEWVLWARLPLQFVFIAWVWAACFAERPPKPKVVGSTST
jgi:uncharacterized membrane protein